MQSSLYDKWVEINVDAIEKNLSQVRSILNENVRLIAVVKANAYGHGMVETARILNKQGVDYFAVSYLQEALLLRKEGISASILVFSPIVEEEGLRQAIESGITITVASFADWERAEGVSRQINRKATVHIKVDTGLGRFGLKPDEARELAVKMHQSPQIELEGIYTHMAHAAGNDRYTCQQFKRFQDLTQALQAQGITIPLKHCANSPVLLKFPHMQLDAVRIGTLLSGQNPAGHFPRLLDLQDPYVFKTRIISLRSLPAGSYLGYYRTYRLKQAAQVAVLPVGFIDGLALEVANRPTGWLDLIKSQVKMLLAYLSISRFSLQVEYKGKAYPIRGKVFMQMALVEFPVDLPVEVGDEVIVPIRKTLASPNVERVYIRSEAAVKTNQEG